HDGRNGARGARWRAIDQLRASGHYHQARRDSAVQCACIHIHAESGELPLVCRPQARCHPDEGTGALAHQRVQAAGETDLAQGQPEQTGCCGNRAMKLDLNNLDFNNIGSWPLPAKAIAIAMICAVVIGLVYWFDTQHQIQTLQDARNKEQQLKSVFESKQAKAANLEAYKAQLDEMRQSFGAMLRQLPNKSEVADLLVDISQTGLASGLEFELFKPEPEIVKDFYAELPVTIRVN